MKGEVEQLFEIAGNIVLLVVMLAGSAVVMGVFLGIAARVARWIV